MADPGAQRVRYLDDEVQVMALHGDLGEAKGLPAARKPERPGDGAAVKSQSELLAH
jgi:hypothetical protein